MAKLPHTIDENLHFLCAELDGQLTGLQDYFDAPETGKAQKVIQRAGYSFNLQSRVQNASLRGMSQKKTGQAQKFLMQNCALLARNLDQISRRANRCLIHAEDIRHKDLLRPAAFRKVIKQVRQGVADVLPAIKARDSSGAVKIGQIKGTIDTLYDQMFRTYTRDMRGSKQTEDLSNSLLAANEIRGMGEALQSISEAILSVSIGQSVHFDRYFTLKTILSDNHVDASDIEISPLAETRSGSAISSMRGKTETGEEISAVLKDGERDKLREERQGVKSWHSIYPGLAPKILSYEKRGQAASLLIEYLPGQTFESLLLNDEDALLTEAQEALWKTLRDIWRRTKTDETAQMSAMGQLSARMKDVYRVHPEFKKGTTRMGRLTLPCFDDLVIQAQNREKALRAPFSVHIHGDFNLDNVIYDPAEKKIHFIDLHRSRNMDYVQDVSVFMVSNYRLQVQDTQIRRRVSTVTHDMHKIAAKFARAQNDKTFEYRLALGLARSFASSTRFVFDKVHARRMFLRARFLLETALACPEGKEQRLRLPIKELFGE